MIVWPSGSVEPEPSSVTVAPAAMPLWSGPAFAVGAPFVLTAMSTVSAGLAAPNGSVTTSWKCSVPDRSGRVNVGFCAVALESVTCSGRW